MEKLKTLNLPAAQATDQIEKGRFRIPKNKALRGIRFKFTIPVVKSDAGTTTLSAAMKLAILNALQFTVKYGAAGKRVPFNAALGGLIRELTRFCTGLEVDRYSDTTIGLGTTIAALTTTNVVFTLYLPLGRMYFDPKRQHMIAMGWSQVKMLEIIVKRLAEPLTPLAATLSVGAVTCDVIPDVVTSKYDKFSYVPELYQSNVADYERTLDDALHYLLAEQTNVHASTTIAALTTKFDDEFILNNIDPKDYLDQLNDADPHSGAAQITDTDTILYQVTADKSFEDYPSGRLYVTQPQRNLNPMKLMGYFSPVVSAAEVQADLQYIADEVRKATTFAVNLADVTKDDQIPSRLRAFMPYALFDKTESESERFPSLAATPGEAEPVPFLPASVAKQAQSHAMGLKANGQHLAAAQVAKNIALAIPGAVPNGRGLSTATTPIARKVGAHVLGLDKQ